MEAHKKAMQDLKGKKCEDFKKSLKDYEEKKTQLSGKYEILKGIFRPLNNVLQKYKGKYFFSNLPVIRELLTNL